MAGVFLGENKEIHEFHAQHACQPVQRHNRRALPTVQDMGQMPLTEGMFQIEAVQGWIARKEELAEAFPK